MPSKMKYLSCLLLMFLHSQNNVNAQWSGNPVIQNQPVRSYYPLRRSPPLQMPFNTPLKLKPQYPQRRMSPYPENLPFPPWQRNLVQPYPKPSMIQRRHISAAPLNFNQLDELQRQKAMRDVKDTIHEVERLLAQDPHLPRLTRGEIEELFENVTREELHKSILRGDKRREKHMRALMLVLPYHANDASPEKLQKLYTKPPMTRMVTTQRTKLLPKNKPEPQLQTIVPSPGDPPLPPTATALPPLFRPVKTVHAPTNLRPDLQPTTYRPLAVSKTPNSFNTQQVSNQREAIWMMQQKQQEKLQQILENEQMQLRSNIKVLGEPQNTVSITYKPLYPEKPTTPAPKRAESIEEILAAIGLQKEKMRQAALASTTTTTTTTTTTPAPKTTMSSEVKDILVSLGIIKQNENKIGLKKINYVPEVPKFNLEPVTQKPKLKIDPFKPLAAAFPEGLDPEIFELAESRYHPQIVEAPITTTTTTTTSRPKPKPIKILTPSVDIEAYDHFKPLPSDAVRKISQDVQSLLAHFTTMDENMRKKKAMSPIVVSDEDYSDDLNEANSDVVTSIAITDDNKVTTDDNKVTSGGDNSKTMVEVPVLDESVDLPPPMMEVLENIGIKTAPRYNIKPTTYRPSFVPSRSTRRFTPRSTTTEPTTSRVTVEENSSISISPNRRKFRRRPTFSTESSTTPSTTTTPSSTTTTTTEPIEEINTENLVTTLNEDKITTLTTVSTTTPIVTKLNEEEQLQTTIQAMKEEVRLERPRRRKIPRRKQQKNSNVFNPTEQKSSEQEDYRKLELLLQTIKQLDKLNVNLTDTQLDALNLQNLNFSDQLLSNQGPDPVALHLNDLRQLKNEVKRQQPDNGDKTEDTPFETEIKTVIETTEDLEPAVETPETATPAEESKDSGASADDLKDSFPNDQDPEEPINEELPPPRKNGFYFFSDWNSFLEVGEDPEKVVVRFDPKIGDPSRFIPVEIPTRNS